MVQPSVSIAKYLVVLYDQVYSIRYVEFTSMNVVTWQTYNNIIGQIIFWKPVKYPNNISLTDRLIPTFIAYSMKRSELTHINTALTSQGSLGQNCSHSVRSLNTIPSVNLVWCTLLKT